jgi:UDP-3-O-[3-hydroxymyristoyl] glucosamine N-acyltransferase
MMPINHIGEDVKLGKDTKIWHFAYIGDHTEIGDHTSIGSLTHIDHHVKIGCARMLVAPRAASNNSYL